ncbi:dolichyl-phosphate-mannose--protein mannosyltransferase [Amnibacterium kyonggiense]|uniref:Polyprenol-phosphate-mannose--protein mannosyltransferase n=1 Tax=Amnibacterium kyonggiense TaxID=595671 RepID=A0A4R7FS07_9MICO|nr:phospholipid carrier-dependent glycosyltransferase [Amnibacterium kyonggiense]TDS80600.1 dolichyl-phosphate-mannose-protein mannosyltransferase [Amnibacterium kyonggiense]
MSQAVVPAQETPAARPTLFDRVSYWARYGPPAVLLVAAVSRLVGLGYPPKLIFDETYYVKDAWSLIHLGYEGTWPGPDDAGFPKGFTSTDDAFAAGHVDFFTGQASYIAHPPLGKWIIGVGELLAGGATNPYGWRLSVAIVGILAVALLMLVAHRMFRTPLVTTLAGGFFAIDNQAIVMSRVGLLDNMVMLFALAGFACVLEDRFWAERRLGAWLMRRRRGIGDWGPALLWRPWLIGAGVAFGLCSAVKWSGLYFLAAFGLYALGSDLLLRRRAGVRLWHVAGLLKQGPMLFVSLVPPALLAYLAGWTGWFLTSGGYDRQAIQNGTAKAATGFFSWVPIPIQDLWQWTTSIYVFHTGLDTPHPYMAPAALWPLIARPTSMWWDSNAGSCGTESCVSAITDLPNPLIWYAAVAASIYLLVRFIRKREWQAALILMGFVGGYLPWLQYPDRTMFFFYSIAFEPYMLLALAATIGLMVVKPPAADSPDELIAMEASYGLRIRRVVVAVFVVAAVVLSVFFFPISAGLPVPYWFWHIHMWSPTWI